MADYERGFKAGIIGGLIYSVFSPMFSYISYSSTAYYGSSYSSFVLFASIISGILLGFIGGLIFGFIFAAAYEKIPGTSAVVKSIILSIFFWLALSFSFNLILMTLGSESTGTSLSVALVSYLLFGYFIGMVWERIKPTEKFTRTETIRRCTNCGRVIPQDSKLCAYCGKRFLENEKPFNEKITM